MSSDSGELLTKQPVLSRWKKVLAIACGVVVIGGGGFWGFKALKTEKIEYLTMPATQGRIIDTVQATGTVKPLQEVDLKFKNDGTLQTLNARVGLEVKQGDQLAVQDDADLRTAVDQAANEVVQAKYRLRQAELELEKVKATTAQQEALYKAGAVSQADYDQARRDYENAVINRDMAQASITSAEVRLQIAQNTLKDAIITAPFDGIISSVSGEVGQDSMAVNIHIISPQLQVTAQVNEADIPRVKPNQPAYLTLASQGTARIKGTVIQISPQAVTVNNIQLYEVAIKVSDDSKVLMPGMSVTANIIANQSSTEMTLVPNLAFTYAQTFQRSSTPSTDQQPSQKQPAQANSGAPRAVRENRSGNQRAAAEQVRRVVVLKEGQPELREVKTGLTDGQNTEIISGLEPEEQVVIGTNQQGTQSNTFNQPNSGQRGNSTIRVRPGGPGPMF